MTDLSNDEYQDYMDASREAAATGQTVNDVLAQSTRTKTSADIGFGINPAPPTVIDGSKTRTPAEARVVAAPRQRTKTSAGRKIRRIPGTVDGPDSVRVDGIAEMVGDEGTSIPVQNLTGVALEHGQRVMVEFVPPNGAFVVGIIGDTKAALALRGTMQTGLTTVLLDGETTAETVENVTGFTLVVGQRVTLARDPDPPYNLLVIGSEDDATVDAQIAAGAVDTTELATDAVTNPKVADNAIDTLEIATAAVDTLEIATDAITNIKIASSAVDTLEIATAAVDTLEIATDAITNIKIDTNAVDTLEIASSAVDTVELAADGVTNAKVGAGAIDTLEIATAAVDTAELATGAVTNLKVSDVAADKITAGTVTGSTLRTAGGSSTRVEVSTVVNGLRWYATTTERYRIALSGSTVEMGNISGAVDIEYHGDTQEVVALNYLKVSPDLFVNDTSATPPGARGLAMNHADAFEVYRRHSTASNGIAVWYSDNGSTKDLQAQLLTDGDWETDTGVYTTISDERLKDNIAPLAELFDPIAALRSFEPKRFDKTRKFYEDHLTEYIPNDADRATEGRRRGKEILIEERWAIRDRPEPVLDQIGWIAQESPDWFTKLSASGGWRTLDTRMLPVLHAGWRHNDARLEDHDTRLTAIEAALGLG